MTEIQKIYAVTIALCVVGLVLTGLIICLVRRTDKAREQIEYLERRSDFIQGEVAGLLARLNIESVTTTNLSEDGRVFTVRLEGGYTMGQRGEQVEAGKV